MFGVCRKVQSLNVEACVASYYLMLLAFCQREATRRAICAYVADAPCLEHNHHANAGSW